VHAPKSAEGVNPLFAIQMALAGHVDDETGGGE